MTWWIASAEPRRAFAVQEDIRALGVECEVPREIYPKPIKRKGIVPAERPILGQYVFFNATPDQWHQVAAVRHLRPTMQVISARIADRLLLPFIRAAEAEYTARKTRIEAGERVARYADGDPVMILAGKMRGEIVTFRRMLDTWPPRVVVSVGTMWGKDALIEIDALRVGDAQHA